MRGPKGSALTRYTAGAGGGGCGCWQYALYPPGQLAATDSARCAGRALADAAQSRLLTAGRDPVQAPPWPVFGLGEAGILPAAGQQAGPFEPGQRLVQRAVRGQPPGGAGIAELAGHGKTVETGLTSGGQLDAASQDRLLDRQQLTHPPAHATHNRKIASY
jgi:hypothetical protein